MTGLPPHTVHSLGNQAVSSGLWGAGHRRARSLFCGRRVLNVRANLCQARSVLSGLAEQATSAEEERCGDDA